jgi:hypothetical protein
MNLNPLNLKPLSRWLRYTPPAAFNVVLPSGLPLQVAFVTPAHAHRFTAGYERLSEHSRRMRFFGQVSSLSSKQLEFLTQPDGKNHMAYAALDLDHADDPGVGVVRAIRLDADSKIAEVALTILDHYQRRGAGLLLHAAVHVHAASVGIEQFLYDVSTENERFVQHLLALGAVRVSQDKDVIRLRLPVARKPESVRGESPAAERFRQMLKLVLAAEAAVPVVHA